MSFTDVGILESSEPWFRAGAKKETVKKVRAGGGEDAERTKRRTRAGVDKRRKR